MNGLTLPVNRLFIIALAAASVGGMYGLLFRTGAGLRIRAVTQNRAMSACLGVRAGWVDATTFALGAGLAGLAGCALTQIGNVGPSLGQNYIVDSFMVVVTGGVGKLAGTILALMAGFYIFGYRPQNSRLQELRAQIARRQYELRESQSKTSPEM